MSEPSHKPASGVDPDHDVMAFRDSNQKLYNRQSKPKIYLENIFDAQ